MGSQTYMLASAKKQLSGVMQFHFHNHNANSWPNGLFQLVPASVRIGSAFRALLGMSSAASERRSNLERSCVTDRNETQAWSRFTENLLACGSSVPERVVLALAELAGADSGVLWLRGDSGFELEQCWNRSRQIELSADALAHIAEFARHRTGPIDIVEYREHPHRYRDLSLPDSLLQQQGAWLIIPLILADTVVGVTLLEKTEPHARLMPELRDLLRLAARQSASELAQHKAQQELQQARRFEACSKLSAYVVHDLKNILAQQSLIVSNAERHKHNPLFINDMIGTVQHSVDRMHALMRQVHRGTRENACQTVELNALLQELVVRHSTAGPRPQLTLGAETLAVSADRERLQTVLGHIVQNAKEACSADDDAVIGISLTRADDSHAEISIEDNGIGMDEHFLREKLFKPFETSKGPAGMGIGAFESREYVRSLGGDIKVTSTPGVGSLFRIVLPCQSAEVGTWRWQKQQSGY